MIAVVPQNEHSIALEEDTVELHSPILTGIAIRNPGKFAIPCGWRTHWAKQAAMRNFFSIGQARRFQELRDAVDEKLSQLKTTLDRPYSSYSCADSDSSSTDSDSSSEYSASSSEDWYSAVLDEEPESLPEML
jgi:hypothetical protein